MREKSNKEEVGSVFLFALGGMALLGGLVFHEIFVFQSMPKEYVWWLNIIIGVGVFIEYMITMLCAIVMAAPSGDKTRKQNIINGIIYGAFSVLIQTFVFAIMLGRGELLQTDLAELLLVVVIVYVCSYFMDQ